MTELKKTLGAVSGTAMMLNVVLGAGLLILPGLAAKTVGAASFWVWVVAIAAALPLLWVFAMLSAKFPSAGGIAHLVEQAFGRIGSVVASFIFLGAVLFGLPSVALTGGYYYESLVSNLLGTSEHAEFAWNVFGDANSMAMWLLFISCGLNLYAPDTAKKFGAMAAVLMSTFIICVIALAVYSLHTKMPFSVMQINLGEIISLGNLEWSAVTAIFFMVFFAFTGWEVSIGMGGEFKKPARNIPIAIFASFVLAALLSLGCVLVVLLAGPEAWHEAAFASILPAEFSVVVALGAVLLIAVNLFAAIWGVSRLIYSLALQGALPSRIGKLTRNQVPRNAVLLFFAIGWSMLLVDRFSTLTVNDFLSWAGLNFFVLYGLATAVAVLKLRGIWHRCTALAVVFLVTALLVVSVDWQSVIYPLGLAGLGVLVGLSTRKNASATK